MPAGGVSLNGPITMTLWSSTHGENNKDVSYAAWVYDCIGFFGCSTIASTVDVNVKNWNLNTNSWEQQHDHRRQLDGERGGRPHHPGAADVRARGHLAAALERVPVLPQLHRLTFLPPVEPTSAVEPPSPVELVETPDVTGRRR